MYCEKHPKYTGYRRPRNECLSCWRVYLNKKDKILPDYIKSISSKSPELAEYLLNNQSNIMLAPVIRETVMESPSGFEFSESLEELIEEGFGEAFEDLPKEDIKEGVLPEANTITVSGHDDPNFFSAKRIAEEKIEEVEEALGEPKPQRGRFV